MKDNSSVSAPTARTFDQAEWDALYRSQGAGHIDDILGRYKAGEFLRLIRAWLPPLAGRCILKTDLNEEAFGEDQILFAPVFQGARVCGFDISGQVVAAAERQQRRRDVRQEYICADVRRLPYAEGVFDVVLSTSTLDHFTSRNDFIIALKELLRVTRQDGSMILAMNNRLNINYYGMVMVARLLGQMRFPVQFYTPAELERIVTGCGWEIRERTYSVHIMSPLNTVLRMARKRLPAPLVDTIAARLVAVAGWLGKRRMTRRLTGWFITLQCCPQRKAPP